MRNSFDSRLATAAAITGGALVFFGFIGCGNLDKLVCANSNCGWSETESARLEALSDLPATPPADPSNKYAALPAAQQLGRKLFWDTRFSGVSTGADALKRPVPYGRAAKGQPLGIACVTCHDLGRGGIDPSTVPGNVSLGASWTDVNTPTIFNDAYRPLVLWNARADSLWGQAPATIEGAMGSNRLRTAWIIATYYRSDYEAVFTDWPLPMTGGIADLTPALETTAPLTGQCKMNGGCPAACRTVQDPMSAATGCFPHFPLDGKPGNKAGCQPADPTEPFGDAWDCMDPADQTALLRVIVNFSKAIAAFEGRLITRNSAFDQFVADLRAGRANESALISDAAKNGARLFVGKAGCSDCHNTPLLTDDKFYNIGIPQTGPAVPTINDCPKGGVCDCVTPSNCTPFGVLDGIQKLRKNAYLRTSAWSDDPQDTSRQVYMDMPLDSLPKGGWRTPSLRDVALTAPYMHDGALATLEDVVDHYNLGAAPLPNGQPSARIQPLFLTDQEKTELVAFLKTLTGEPLTSDLSDPPQLPPSTP
jgi:cytochrome c peroxidase